DRQWEGMVIGDIGTAYLELGYRDQAFDYLNRRLAYERAQKNTVGEREALRSLGAAYATTGERKKAREAYQQALDICLREQDTVSSESLDREIVELKEAIKRLH